MTTPGTYVSTATRSISRRATPPAATVFWPLEMPYGDGEPILCTSVDEVEAAIFTIPGGPTTPALQNAVYDIVSSGAEDLRKNAAQLFANGADRVYLKRYIGLAPNKASLILLDAADDPALTIETYNYGQIGNAYAVTVAAGTSSGVKVTVSAPGVPDLLDDIVLDNLANNEAIAAAFAANEDLAALFAVTVGEGLIVDTLAESNLTGGDDGEGGLDVLYRFPADLGPGVIIDGGDILLQFLVSNSEVDETAAELAAIAGAALDTRRIIIGDAVFGAATAAAAEVAIVAAGTRLGLLRDALVTSYSAEYADTVLGVLGVFYAGYTTVDEYGANTPLPASFAVAGLRAQAITDIGPHRAPAGEAGIIVNARSSIGWLNEGSGGGPVTDALAAAAHLSGGNAIRDIAGTVRVYGWRSLADPESDWAMLTARDTINAIAAEADERTEPLAFRPIDGKGQLIAELAGILTAIGEEAKAAGSTFPLVADDGTETDPGYSVDVGPAVNTTETLAAGELRGVLAIRPTPTASLVYITVVKVAPNGAL